MNTKLQVASFFAGIGGFDLGFESAGMEVIFQCEKDDFCRGVLKKHWPAVPLMRDINDLNPNDVPTSDVYCGGFPCQDVSLANQGKRAGLNGRRSGLFYKFAELIGANKPEWVVIENVRGLFSSQEGEDFRTVVRTLDEFGYGVAWRLFDAKYFGTPQRRRRIFIVASYQSKRAFDVLFTYQSSKFPAKQSNVQEQTLANGTTRCNRETNLYSIQHAGIGRKPSAGPQGPGYRNDGETWTLDRRGTADAVCAPYAPFGIRDSSGISRKLDRQRHGALGNAVCVPVAKWIGEQIISVHHN